MKQYYTVDPITLDDTRNDRGEFKIKDCMAQNMFPYFPDGLVQGKISICSCDSCLEGKFVDCSVEIGSVQHSLDDDSSDNGNAEYEHEYCLDFTADSALPGDVLDAIQNDIIRLLTPKQFSEQFFLCKVLYYGIASKELCDKKKKNCVCLGEQ